MSTTLQTNELTLRTSIIQKINLIFNDEEYTFEAFILMKGNHMQMYKQSAEGGRLCSPDTKPD